MTDDPTFGFKKIALHTHGPYTLRTNGWEEREKKNTNCLTNREKQFMETDGKIWLYVHTHETIANIEF